MGMFNADTIASASCTGTGTLGTADGSYAPRLKDVLDKEVLSFPFVKYILTQKVILVNYFFFLLAELFFLF